MSRAASTTFTVTGRKWANLNGSHGSHYAHQGLMNEWKSLALAAIRDAGCRPVEQPVHITARVCRTTNAHADSHNVTPTIKAAIDAAVTSGLIEDDHDGIVTRLITERGPNAKRPSIELHISHAPAQEKP